MIADLDIGGVLIPGLLAFALIALAATVAVIRLLSAAGIDRAMAHGPLVEIAIFTIIFALLLQHHTGLFP